MSVVRITGVRTKPANLIELSVLRKETVPHKRVTVLSGICEVESNIFHNKLSKNDYVMMPLVACKQVHHFSTDFAATE